MCVWFSTINIDNFNNCFFGDLMLNIPANTDSIICGDVNVNMFNPCTSYTTEDYINNCVGMNFLLLLISQHESAYVTLLQNFLKF